MGKFISELFNLCEFERPWPSPVLPNGPILSDFGPKSDFFRANGPILNPSWELETRLTLLNASLIKAG